MKLFWALSVCLLLLLITLASIPADKNWIHTIYYLLVAANIFYVTMIFIFRQKTIPLPKYQLVILSVCFIVLRIGFSLKSPILSDDIYRYYSDGLAINNGINPYISPPHGKAFQAFQNDPLLRNVNHGNLPTIYPLLSVAIATMSVAISKGLWGLKAAHFFFEILLWLTLLHLMRIFKISRKHLFWFISSPLAITEIHWSGHNDIIGISLMMLAFSSLFATNRLKGGIAAALAMVGSIFAKYISLLTLPFIAASHRLAGRSFWLTGGVLISVVSLAAWKSGFTSGSLSTYLNHWHFNGILFYIGRTIGIANPRPWLLACFGIANLIILVRFWRSQQTNFKIVPTLALMWTVFFICSPTVFPWYLLWLLPFAVLCAHPGYLFFTSVVVLAYWTQVGFIVDGQWLESEFILILQYFLQIMLNLLLFYRNRQRP